MLIRAVDEFNAGGHLIYAENLPGAFVRGRTRDEALAKFPAEAARYCRWAGLDAGDGAWETAVVQEKESALQVCDADSDVLFDAEREPLTAAAYEALKALALRSAADFQALFDSVPDKEGTVLKRRETFYGPLPVTAQEMYDHTRNVNSYYFGEIGVKAGNEPDIRTCRAAGFAALETQAGFLCGEPALGSWDEWWSLRKVFRRFLWHDRIHARAMWRMATRLCGAEMIADPFGFGA